MSYIWDRQHRFERGSPLYGELLRQARIVTGERITPDRDGGNDGITEESQIVAECKLALAKRNECSINGRHLHLADKWQSRARLLDLGAEDRRDGCLYLRHGVSREMLPRQPAEDDALVALDWLVYGTAHARGCGLLLAMGYTHCLALRLDDLADLTTREMWQRLGSPPIHLYSRMIKQDAAGKRWYIQPFLSVNFFSVQKACPEKSWIWEKGKPERPTLIPRVQAAAPLPMRC